MRSETNLSDWVPINVAARMLGISGQAIRNWVRQGKLRCRVHPEKTPRLGTQYKHIKHVCWNELVHLHQQVLPLRVRRSYVK